MDLWGFAFWGLLGAFIYAAPRLLVAFGSGGQGSRWLRFSEFVVALTFGPIGAAGFTQFLGNTVHQTTQAELRALALVVGMISNPVAPGVVHILGTGVMRRLGGVSMRGRHGK